MSVNSDNLQVATGFGGKDEFIVNVQKGTGRMAGAEAVKFFDQFFPYALYNYEGVNIKEKFAGEMDYTEPWIWLNQRLAVKDISGLHIKDFFEVEAGGNLLQMQIADLNHDLGFMDTEITQFHIDFISKDVWPETHAWNKVNYNNGIAGTPSPWLASDLKAWLNSEKANVPNGTGADPDTVAVDYTATGVLHKLPASLRSVIVERRSYEPTRYTAGELLTDDASAEYVNIGKLWVPSEIEVYGFVAQGTRNVYTCSGFHQFPIFIDGRTRIKRFSHDGSRSSWSLRSVCSGNSRNKAVVSLRGACGYNVAAYSHATAVCFRISG